MNSTSTRGVVPSVERGQAPGVDVAHPTSDHFVPLLVTVGAAAEPSSAVSAIDRMVLGNSTRSVRMS